MRYNVVTANKEQANKLYRKHISKPCFKLSYSYDDEDDLGFFSFVTLTGKRVEGQLRGDIPCYIEVTGFGNARYDIDYPNQYDPKLYKRLQCLALECRSRFLRGSEI